MFAVLASALLLFVVLEMVRRRRLMERYALLWLLSAVVLIALAFILLLLLHFSSAVSRLSDQAKVLAQRSALLEERLRRLEGEGESESAETVDQAASLAEPEANGKDHEAARSEELTGSTGRR